MKRLYLILMPLLLLVVASSVLAQTRDDRDGDGIPDTRDQCPDVAGSPENNGCPVFQIVPPPAATPDPQPPGNPGNLAPSPLLPTVPPPARPDTSVPPPAQPDPNDPPPAQPDPNDPPPSQPDSSVPLPPFQPPALPADGCWATPAGAYNVFARENTGETYSDIGLMAHGVVYQGLAIVIKEDGEAWFATVGHESGTGDVGFGAAWYLIISEDCPIVYRDPARPDGPDTAEYEPDQADIDAMVADCGEDNWGYVFDDDELTGYYCLDDDTASYEPDQADIDAMVADCGEDNWGYVFDDDELTGYYCEDDSTTRNEPITPADIAFMTADCGEGQWRYVYNKEGQITGYACIEAQTMTRYPVGDPTGDCDGNGVEDGIEFNPPDCFIAPDVDGDPTAIDVDDDDRDFMNEQCPSGWLVYETTTADGDTVVQGECIEEDDPVTSNQGRNDDDIMDTLLWTVCPNGWSTGNDGSFQCEDNVIDDDDSSSTANS